MNHVKELLKDFEHLITLTLFKEPQKLSTSKMTNQKNINH